MWLRKEIWHHRKMHRLTVIATAMAVFLLMSVNILSDGLLKMIKAKTGDMGLDVSLLQVRDEIGFKFLGVEIEADVGEVDAIDGAFVIGSPLIISVDIEKVARVLFLEPLVIAEECGIFAWEIVAEEGVVFFVAVFHAFDHENGNIGAQGSQNLDKVVGESVAHHFGAIRDGVENVGDDIRNSSHGTSHAEVHFSLAAESQIDALHIEVALNDTCAHHTGPCGASSLEHAGAVEHDFLAQRGRIDRGCGDDRGRVDTDTHPVDAVVERQVEHILMHLSVEIFDESFSLNGVACGSVTIHKFPNAVGSKYVKVGPLDAGICHVWQVSVPQEVVLDADALRVGGKSERISA